MVSGFPRYLGMDAFIAVENGVGIHLEINLRKDGYKEFNVGNGTVT